MSSAGDKRREAPAAAGGGAAAAKAARPATAAIQNEVFSPELLEMYYKKFFPYDLMFRWLSYDNDPDKPKAGTEGDFFSRREFSFTIANDVYIRYLSFRDAAGLARGIAQRQPHKIDIGAVFSANPARHQTMKSGAFQPVERELVFDIDLTDYDEVRTCCKGARICERCWPFMTVAMKLMDKALDEDFGFEHRLWIYSGRRGVHCWVCDEAARKLTDKERSAVVEYMSVIQGDMATNLHGMVKTTTPLHPSLQRALAELTTMFTTSIITQEGQGLLGDDEEQWEKVLSFLPKEGTKMDEVRSQIRDAWRRRSQTPDQRWHVFKSLVEQAALFFRKKDRSNSNRFKIASALERVPTVVVLAFTYPRIDVAVSKHRNHLLKSPWCVHPKTGRVCVPVSIQECEDFNPLEVPTIPQLLTDEAAFNARRGDEAAEDERAAAAAGGRALRGTLSKTSLGPAVRHFEAFVRGLEASARLARRAEAEEDAVMGEW